MPMQRTMLHRLILVTCLCLLVCAEVQAQTGQHVAPRDEQQKWLAGCATLELDQRIDPGLVGAAPEPVDGLRRIGQHASAREVGKDRRNRRVDLGW